MVKLYFESPQEWKSYTGMAQEALSYLRGEKQEKLNLEDLSSVAEAAKAAGMSTCQCSPASTPLMFI
ncbi:MAG: hypothetical protein WCP58_13000 [bacterium]|jgi:hypothetical protein